MEVGFVYLQLRDSMRESALGILIPNFSFVSHHSILQTSKLLLLITEAAAVFSQLVAQNAMSMKHLNKASSVQYSKTFANEAAPVNEERIDKGCIASHLASDTSRRKMTIIIYKFALGCFGVGVKQGR